MMKRFLSHIAIFFVLLFVIDRVVGFSVSYMSKHSKGGYIGHHNYIIYKTNEDILIFGSSRAIHHYNPQIITDSLGLSCYNCGQDGNGILLFYGWWQLIKERYKPKIIIYDITTSFDLLKGEANNKYLGWLKEYYNQSKIGDIFNDVDPTEKIKLRSKLYRYNSQFLQITADYIYPLLTVGDNGFLPLSGEIDTMKINKERKEIKTNDISFDSLKIAYINKFIDETKDVKLFFVVSPIWYGQDSTLLEPIKSICREREIPCLDYSNDQSFFHNNMLFRDGMHLNSKGALVFTNDLVKRLKELNVLSNQTNTETENIKKSSTKPTN